MLILIGHFTVVYTVSWLVFSHRFFNDPWEFLDKTDQYTSRSCTVFKLLNRNGIYSMTTQNLRHPYGPRTKIFAMRTAKSEFDIHSFISLN